MPRTFQLAAAALSRPLLRSPHMCPAHALSPAPQYFVEELDYLDADVEYSVRPRQGVCAFSLPMHCSQLLPGL